MHVGVLVAPDLVGAPSVIPLVASHGAVVACVLRLKRLGHEWGSLLGGRSTHPNTVVPGGFSVTPTKTQLKELKKKILDHADDMRTFVKFVVSLAGQIPVFERPTEYMALHSKEDYGMYDGDIQTVMPDGKKQTWPVSDYRKVTNEFVVAQSTAKYAKNKLDSYAAGALARFNNNFDQLHPEAKALAESIGMKPLNTNPYFNSVAQLVEIVHSVYESLDIINKLVNDPKYDEFEPLVMPSRFGTGAGASEVPRGILFHEYSYDKDGMCTSGNCIIPTNQNHANIQKDFDKLVSEMLAAGKDQAYMEQHLSMLVRAYDPCISCSTHYLTVDFVE